MSRGIFLSLTTYNLGTIRGKKQGAEAQCLRMLCFRDLFIVNQRRLVTLSRTRAFSIDYNILPRNPGQPTESAKPVHYIQCAGIKFKFAKIVTNLL